MPAQAQIIDQIVDSARAIQGVLRAEPQRVALDTLIEQAASLARRTLGVNAPAIDIHPHPYPLTLELDASRMQRAIANVIVNAAKHRPPAAPAIAVVPHAAAGMAEIRVTQAGAHIDPRALAEIPLHGDKPAPGLDLQMALARQLIELQGGHLVLRAAGATVPPSLVIRLPGKAPKRPPADARRAFGAREQAPHARLDGAHVLLIEDDADALDFLALILRQAGANVSAYTFAAPAYDFFVNSERLPDIIVSDVAMPVEDGYSLLHRLRTWESSHGRVPVPAVAVSAFARDEDVQRAQAHGFDRHIAKPVDASHLVKVIASWTSARP